VTRQCALIYAQADARLQLRAADVMDRGSLAPHFEGADTVFFAAAGKVRPAPPAAAQPRCHAAVLQRSPAAQPAALSLPAALRWQYLLPAAPQPRGSPLPAAQPSALVG
jgi:uncharacterized protein YbjT (DUF2867 family)